MECQLDPREDSELQGKQYFSPEILPKKLKARSFELTGERTFDNKEDVTVLYIRSGKGNAWLSGQALPLEPGTLLMLYPFHIRRIQSQPGDVLKGEECVLNIGSMLFIFALTPHRRPVRIFDESPSFYQITDAARQRVEGLWNQLIAENQMMDYCCRKIQFALFIRIMVVCRKHGKIIV